MPVVVTGVGGRLRFPQERTVFVSGAGGLRVARSGSVTMYVDEAATIPADIQEIDGTPILDSKVEIVDKHLSYFLGPEGAEVLYVRGGRQIRSVG